MVKNFLLSLLFVSLWVPWVSAQTTTVSGVVLDELNNPIIGASVVLADDDYIGVSTDVDGAFTLKGITSKSKQLKINYIGYAEKIVDIAPYVEVKLEMDAFAVESVVVTGLTKTDKRLFTGASDNIKADAIKLAGEADISRSLEGRSAGVSVQNVSGTFGSAPKIRIRGATSIFGNSTPLWVVDGVIVEDVVEIDADALSSGDATTLISSAIAGLNADDIESFNVLKDGSATSIYGARAMAGVIVITTKKGRVGESRITYSGEFTTRLIPSYSDYNIMNSQQQMGVYQELESKGWLNIASVSNASSSGVYGKMWDAVNNGTLSNTTSARNEFLRAYETINTDWFDVLFSSAVMQSHSVSVSSGSEKSQYYASLSVMNDPGWTVSSSVERYTASMNTSYKIRNDLTFNIISNASYRKQLAPGTLSSSTDAVFGEVKRDFDINPYSYALNTSRTLDPDEYYTRNYAPFNILSELENNYIDIDVVDTKFQAELRYTPIEGLDIAALGAVKYYATMQEHNITDFSNQAIAYRTMPTTTIRDNNPFLYTDPDDPYAVPISILPEGGILNRTDNKMLSYDMRFSASYNTIINQDHIINAFAGTEINSSERHETWFRGWGMQYSLGEIPFYAYEVFKKGVEDNTDYYGMSNGISRNVAAFANMTYSWRGKYTVNGTARYEGTNRMGLSNAVRWLPTWNIAGSWNIDEEEFFEALRPAMSNLTLKTSYSLTADRGPSYVTNSNVIISSYSPWRPDSDSAESGLYIYSLENSELTYEKKHELNIGLSAGFLEGRINLAADWYQRDNYDLIGLTNTQGVGGEILKYGNVASMRSSGYELTLSSLNIKTKNFSWTTDFIYAKSKSLITDLYSNQRAIDMVSGTGLGAENYPVGAIFSYDFQGLDENGFPTFLNESGEVTISDINFQERDNLDHLVYEGTSTPTDYGSLGNMFQYKGFRFNVFLTYSFGNVVRLDPIFSSSYSDLTSTPVEFEDRWLVPGDELNTNIPVIASTRDVAEDPYLSIGYNAYNYSTARIAKGDFIRLKELSLSYDLDKSYVERLNVNAISVKLQASNLFLLYSDSALNGQDPEFLNSGGVAVPVPKQFTLSLKIVL